MQMENGKPFSLSFVYHSHLFVSDITYGPYMLYFLSHPQIPHARFCGKARDIPGSNH
ncbi:hypothetical protein Hdeb2414_s0012g00388391 [Helianthus debilis subsp. tardiflorus]